MEFFTAAIDGLQTIVTALGAGLAIWGLVSLLEAYTDPNGGQKSNGIKQLMAGGGIILIAQTVIPKLSSLF